MKNTVPITFEGTIYNVHPKLQEGVRRMQETRTRLREARKKITKLENDKASLVNASYQEYKFGYKEAFKKNNLMMPIEYFENLAKMLKGET